MKFGQSQPARRVEDIRFLTGQGRYVDDIAPENALRAWFLRSDRAHGVISQLDVTAARDMPGVHLVLTADDLRAAGVQTGMRFSRVTNRDGSKGAGPARPVLAEGRVRFVGEAIAMVVAETLDQARDAAELIGVEIDELPVALSLEPGGAALHDAAAGNLAFDFGIGREAETAEALAQSAHVVRLEVIHNRVIVNPLEPRGAWADWKDGRLHLCVNGQGVWTQKRELARMLGLPEGTVRVTNPDVGGGFGMKAMTYPEYVVIAQAARMLGRPVRWMAERGEGMLSDNAGRDLIARAEMGFDADLRITGYRVTVLSNLLWLPPVMQEASGPYWRVIECELLSGLDMRRFQKPRADMVISGSGPNLGAELIAQSSTMVFPIQICSIVAPIQVIGFSHSPWHRHWLVTAQ